MSDWEGATTSTRMYSYPQELSGRKTCVMAQVRDAAGNVSSWTAERCSQIPYDQLQIFHSYSGFVERSPGTGDWIGGSYLLSRKRGSELGLGDYVVVKRLGVVATTCPTCGSVAVFLGRTKLASFSLARSTTTMRSLVLTTLPTTLRGRLRLVVTSADGRTVRLDGVAVSAS